MRPLSIALAIFALTAIYSGFSHDDVMMLGLGAASLVSAGLMASPLQSSSFFNILNGLFAVETILFGIVNLIDLDGFWPQSYADYVPPRYLPLATALFIVALYAISQLPFVRRMMKIADPYFEAETPVGFHIRPFPAFTASIKGYARLCIVFLVLLNQFQVFLSVRFNFWQNDFGNAIQVPDADHEAKFWTLLLIGFPLIVTPLILSQLVEFVIAANFVIQWRRWMTASYTSRWLANSMHYRMALAGTSTDNPDQRISQDVGGFINGSGTGTNSGSVGFYNYTISAISTATNLVSFSIILWTISRSMNVSVGGLAIPGLMFWIAILYAVFATGLVQLIGRRLAGLFFRQQTVEANFRFELARVREFGEQIALLKGDEREIERAGSTFADVFAVLKRIINIRVWLVTFSAIYGQISALLPYFIVAPFYFAKQVSFGVFNQSADAFSNVNNSMNFFIDRYIGFADFRATVDRLTSFDDAFARVEQEHAAKRGVQVTVGADNTLATPNLALSLPNGRTLLNADGLILVPQEPTLVVGPSGAGKSTLVARDRRPLALWLRRDQAARPRLADAVAATALLADRLAARRRRLPEARRRCRRRDAERRAHHGWTAGHGLAPERPGQLADAPLRRRAATRRRRARAHRQAGLAVPGRIDGVARRAERIRPLHRHRQGAAEHDAGLHRPSLDAGGLPQAKN